MHPADEDVDGFLDSVSEATRLIEGLKAGTITPEFVDKKIAERTSKQEAVKPAHTSTTSRDSTATAGADAAAGAATAADAAATDAARQADLQRKLEELRASRQRKLRARALYASYVQDKAKQEQQRRSFATDYTQWDMWCPSDEEDDLFNSATPNTPEFRAMERDISSRHQRMVEQRQLAERQRQLGNDAFKAGQYSEALRCYEAGLDAQRHNMALHANAAMAALKLKCYVQVQEHADKVLHLAEVLYDTPKHPLCVKALQRRAVAFQELGQPSRAVADLEAAAEIVPGDAEVLSQLEHALALQQEHRAVRQLTKLAAGGSNTAEPKSEATAEARQQRNTSTAGSCSANNSQANSQADDVTSLQRIKELVAQLAAVRHDSGNGEEAAAAAAAAADAGTICKELQCLVRHDTRFALCFRNCGGLAAAAKLVTSSSDDAVLTACLQLLNSACEANTALEQLGQQHPEALGAVWDVSCSHDTVLAAAAAELAHAASSSPATRPLLCHQLLERDAKSRSAPCRTSCGGSNSSRLERVWQTCCCQPSRSGTTLDTTRQVLVWSALSNCMVVPAARAGTAALLQQQTQSLESLAAQLPAAADVAAAKLYGLFSNMANCPTLRGLLAACTPLTQQLLQVAGAAGGAPRQQAAAASSVDGEGAQAALACFCNLAVEGCVQRQLAQSEAAVGALLQLAVAPWPLHSAAAGSLGGNSSSGSAQKARLTVAPRLPPRSTGTAVRGADASEPPAKVQCAGVPAAGATALVLAERAACLLSRVAKQPAGAQLLQAKGAVGALVHALTASQPTEPAGAGRAKAADAPALQGWTASAVRTLALLTAHSGCCQDCSPAEAAAVVGACCRLLRCPHKEGVVQGNAALVLGQYADAGGGRWRPQLAEADAVGALVAAARSGRGSATSRNAGIVLSRLALADASFLERMRELRGLEVVYEYVKQP